MGSRTCKAIKMIGSTINARLLRPKPTPYATFIASLSAATQGMVGFASQVGASTLLARRRGGIPRLDVRVARGERRCGVGTALVRAALAHADAEGIGRVEATAAVGDAAALALLLRCGFAAEGVLGAGQADGRVVLARSTAAG